MINVGVEGFDLFFVKCEVIDEFGWWYFGDLYVDYEIVGYSGDMLFMLYYNN